MARPIWSFNVFVVSLSGKLKVNKYYKILQVAAFSTLPWTSSHHHASRIHCDALSTNSINVLGHCARLVDIRITAGWQLCRKGIALAGMAALTRSVRYIHWWRLPRIDPMQCTKQNMHMVWCGTSVITYDVDLLWRPH